MAQLRGQASLVAWRSPPAASSNRTHQVVVAAACGGGIESSPLADEGPGIDWDGFGWVNVVSGGGEGEGIGCCVIRKLVRTLMQNWPHLPNFFMKYICKSIKFKPKCQRFAFSKNNTTANISNECHG